MEISVVVWLNFSSKVHPLRIQLIVKFWFSFHFSRVPPWWQQFLPPLQNLRPLENVGVFPIQPSNPPNGNPNKTRKKISRSISMCVRKSPPPYFRALTRRSLTTFYIKLLMVFFSHTINQNKYLKCLTGST